MSSHDQRIACETRNAHWSELCAFSLFTPCFDRIGSCAGQNENRNLIMNLTWKWIYGQWNFFPSLLRFIRLNYFKTNEDYLNFVQFLKLIFPFQFSMLLLAKHRCKCQPMVLAFPKKLSTDLPHHSSQLTHVHSQSPNVFRGGMWIFSSPIWCNWCVWISESRVVVSEIECVFEQTCKFWGQ